MAISTLLLISVLIFVVILYYKRKFEYWKKKNVAFSKPMYFFGHLYPLLTLKSTLGHWLQQQYESSSTDYFGIYAFTKPILIIKSPQIIKDILIRNFSNFDDRTVVVTEKDEVISNFLFVKRNPAWRKIRTKLTPVFSSGKLKLMFPLVVDEARHMVSYISNYGVSGPIEIKEICSKYTTNVIARCAFGVNAKTFENSDSEFRELGRKLFAPTIGNRLRFFAGRYFTSLVTLFHLYLINPSISSGLRNIFTSVIQDRERTKTKRKDLIDILLQLKEMYNNEVDFSEMDRLGAAVNFFAAGFETVASTMAFALYELCIAPELQAKLREEIQNNLRINTELTYNNIAEMTYLDMVTSETLRKYPVVPFIDRTCKADYTIPQTNLVVDAGTPVYIPLFGLHYDKKYFPDPQKFDPERFRDKSAINKDGLYYLPFGEGPRNCIGARFGLMGLKLGLVHILLNFELKAIDETPIPLVYDVKSAIVASKTGLPMKLVPISS